MEGIQKNNPAFLYSDEISQICRGLFIKIGLNAFSYSKVYKDGSRAELWTDVDAMWHSFFAKEYISRVYTPDLFNGQKFIMYDFSVQSFPKEIREKLINQLRDQKELFNHANCLFIIEYKLEYTEYCAFYTPSSISIAVNNYLNYIDDLCKFRRFFRSRAQKIILKAEINKLILPWRQQQQTDVSHHNLLLNHTKNQEKTTKLILTVREEEVANLLCDSMTAKEIANVLCVSQKTAEKHIENIKIKTACNRRTQLINYLNKFYYEKQ